MQLDFVNRDSGFVVIQQNIRSMRENFDSLIIELSLLKHMPKVIVLTEIWIKTEETAFFKIPNYISYFKTNEGYRAGGVAVFVHINVNIINSMCIQFMSADVLEMTFTELGCVFKLVAIYRLHRESCDLFINELNSYLSSSNVRPCSNLIIVGDININLLEDKSLVDEYRLTLVKNGLMSLINEPTRICKNSQSCIDHVMVRIKNARVFRVEAAVIDMGITDHCLTAVWVNGGGSGPAFSAKVTDTGTVPRTACRIKYELLNELLDKADWDIVFQEGNASDAFDQFFVAFKSIILKSTDEVINKKNKIKKLKPWINYSICSRIKKRNELLKRIKKQPNNKPLKAKFKEFRNNLNLDIRNIKNQYYQDLFEKHRGNSKETWKVIEEISGQKLNIVSPIVLEIDNNIVSDPLEVANEFNKYFLSVAGKVWRNVDRPDNYGALFPKNCFIEQFAVNSMFIDPVIECELKGAIETLKNGTSPGLDGIGTHIIKKCYRKIGKVLLYIINLSFQTGVFPEKLKEAVVIPIHKKDSKMSSTNYRPISLLPSFSKIIEKIMKQKLVKYLEITKFFSKNQFGFRRGMNTEMALLQFMDKVTGGGVE